MCGIAGFVTKPLTAQTADASWLIALADKAKAAPKTGDGADALQGVINALQENYATLMSIGMVSAIATDDALAAKVEAFAATLADAEKALTALSEAGQTELDPLIEGLRDYSWQLQAEVVEHARQSLALLGGRAPEGHALQVAIATEYVLRAIDKLEVRGRDSAGIAVQFPVDAHVLSGLSPAHAMALTDRQSAVHADHLAVYRDDDHAGRPVLTFVFKTANLVGSLGDNGEAIRAAMRSDELLWALAPHAQCANILSHTRWASHGVISVANCHPHNPSLTDDANRASDVALGAMYALNGDVDNHLDLENEIVTGRQRAVEPSITTDAKIIPLADRLIGADGGDRLDRFRAAMRRLDGSVAIGCIDPKEPGVTYLAQKGSGQGLQASRLDDGWIFASEVYGLCNVSRSSYNLARSVAGGSVIRLDALEDAPQVRTITDGKDAPLKAEPIQIYARDIFRGYYGFFLEKEINDGPSSVAKTLRGRYRVAQDGMVAFDELTTDIWKEMRKALNRGIKRIYVIGQGTAGVAAVGIGELIERAIARDARARIPVESVRSSELSADIEAYDFERSLVIAVSQSGTTTDTNRAVDLARERGAFVHAIVNRRNSDLVRKSDSVLFTSDGRDVEMSVASTKAFYSQITAGKLTALFIAEQLGTMTPVELAYEMGELEKLPNHIQSILNGRDHIAECAQSLAPFARYWAVTGSGANHIAALEIRIKLSELCYKSIPVDYTEDKKHIDLSTEPLTLVIANDLPGDLVGDVVKEAAIFKAHNGRPVVFATEGHDAEAFGDYAERVIALPAIGGDLAFVLATVAGHLFGFYAARAIDEGAQRLKTINAQLGLVAMGADNADPDALLEALDAFVADATQGAFNSGLGASDIAHVARSARLIGAAHAAGEDIRDLAIGAVMPLQKAYEETSRPVDTIRHQAKTVTVGTSRPEDALSVQVRDALATVSLADSRMSFDNRKTLASLSRMIENIEFTALLDVQGKEVRLNPLSQNQPALASFADGGRALGVLGAALDANALQTGFIGKQSVIVVPVTGASFADTEHLLCLGVTMVGHATREQKTAVMNALGIYGPKLREWEQIFADEGESQLQRAIASESPLTIVFRPQALDAMAASEARDIA
ncbi:MAG: SIS domain-containing protein [Ahrensia sp.]